MHGVSVMHSFNGGDSGYSFAVTKAFYFYLCNELYKEVHVVFVNCEFFEHHSTKETKYCSVTDVRDRMHFINNLKGK